MKKNYEQKGFTLVELAIVLVIIGLLVGALMKGQSMIEDAKQKRLVNDLQGLSAVYFTYFDRYRAIPGDDADTHSWSGINGGNANGYISGSPTIPDGESQVAWQALRYAGLVSGDPASTGLPSLPGHPFGGKFGLSNRNFGSAIGTKNYIGVEDISGRIGETVDLKFDDGKYNSGSVQASDLYSSGTIDLYYAL